MDGDTNSNLLDGLFI